MTRKTLYLLPIVLLIGLFFAPTEYIREKERAFAADLVRKGDQQTATLMYRLLSWQRDSIGISNFHALKYHASIRDTKEVRKAATRDAIAAWKKTGADGVGASYWNIAMFSVNYGQRNRGERKKNTHWLTLAAKADIVAAEVLLTARSTDMGRIKILMETGDPGAAKTYASHHRRNQAEYERGLRIAAEGGHVGAMAELGWALILRPGDDYADSEYWLVKAAESGEIQAANRLGNCHNHKFYFCTKRDAVAAAAWYEKALGPAVRRTPPRITLDANHAIRLGSMPRTYSSNIGHRESASYELAKLLLTGDGVEQDLERAEQLLVRAGGWKDAEELLHKLRTGDLKN